MRIKIIFTWMGIVAVASVAGYLLGIGATAVISQVSLEGDQKIVKEAFTINKQAEFKNVKLGETPIELKEPFDTELDWLKDLSFEVENTSDKEINYIQVNVLFPDTRSTGNLMVYPINFGKKPKNKFFKDKKPIHLAPGESLKVSLDKEQKNLYKFLQERQPLQTINQVELAINFIVFDDGTGWLAGQFMEQDKDNPERYKPIKKEKPDK